MKHKQEVWKVFLILTPNVDMKLFVLCYAQWKTLMASFPGFVLHVFWVKFCSLGDFHINSVNARGDQHSAHVSV